MSGNGKPCCATESLRRIWQVDVGGIVVGLAMLDDIIDEVQRLHHTVKDSIAEELPEWVKVSNYVPRTAEQTYRSALLREFEKEQTP